MDYIVEDRTGWISVAPELSLFHAIEIYGATPPSRQELRDISDHFCRLLMQAKEQARNAPDLDARTRAVCVRAIDGVIVQNAQILALYDE